MRTACDLACAAELLACLFSAGAAREVGRASGISTVRAEPRAPVASLQEVQGYTNIWSVRINEQYRAVGERNGDSIEWAWIGSHNEFDSKFS